MIGDLDGNTLTLRVTEAASAELLRGDLTVVEKAIADVFGVPLKVIVRIDGAARTPSPVVEENDGDDNDDLLGYALKKLQ
jgi:hypothetical protein